MSGPSSSANPRGLIPARWIAIFVFLASSTLNYLDRQLLAATAPTLKAEFHLTDRDYGMLLFAFSIAYAAAAPFAGYFLDRTGLDRGTTVAVALWSLAGMFTGLAGAFESVLLCRALLGAAEAASVPGFGKANGMYLEPRELAIGTAVNQIGLSIGGIAAPLLVGFLAGPFGWRSVFVFCGALGFLWIPAWLYTSRRIPAAPPPPGRAGDDANAMLRDRRFWGLVVANLLYMTMYTLWTNWTTLYFVEARGLSQAEANRQFAWIPPIFATAGGLVGGAMAYRLIRAGMPVTRARMRICLVSAVLLLGTAAVPYMPNAAWAAAAICFSFFWTLVMSTNVYVMPIDFFGAARAGLSVSALTLAYGVMQAFVSPLIGQLIHLHGFAPVCLSFSLLPLLAWGVLRASVGKAA
ncbi:MAG: MFS transporter [Acidobacteria bacterium]|nr:MFS transporter [Acidobacteriota bacterium]